MTATEGLAEEASFKQHLKEEKERAIQIAGRGTHFLQKEQQYRGRGVKTNMHKSLGL